MKLGFFISFLLILVAASLPDWGFYGHKKINRMAVFTLPTEMIGFYKANIEYLTDHSVDPDKRRYATKHEAIRHYIDIDHWGSFPFDNVPRKNGMSFMKYSEIKMINSEGDTTSFHINNCWNDTDTFAYKGISVYCEEIENFFYNHIIDQYYEDEIFCDCGDFEQFMAVEDLASFSDCQKLIFVDHFREYGILPYWLPQIYEDLVEALSGRDKKRILRLSAEIGHYIGDAHVPLHTTENYNGQLTDQLGIHAFWESRLPELFADGDYDFFVGKAEYIEDVNAYFWDVVLKSHSYLDEVLSLEKDLSLSFPEDQQFCFDERKEITILTQCRAYSETYHQAMDGMVEDRMRDAIRSIGSSWYSAWLDAGQPDLNFEEVEWTDEDVKKQKELEQQFNEGSIKGREHSG